MIIFMFKLQVPDIYFYFVTAFDLHLIFTSLMSVLEILEMHLIVHSCGI